MAQSVPTMSEWTLKIWAAGLLACATFAAAVWNQPAIAVPLAAILMNQPAGGTADIPSHPDLFTGDFFHDYAAQNQTPKPQGITGISLSPGLSIPPSGPAPKCVVGLELKPNDVCYVRVYKEPT